MQSFSQSFGREDIDRFLQRVFPGQDLVSLTDIPTSLIMPVIANLHKVDRYDQFLLRVYGIEPGTEDREDPLVQAILQRNPIKTWFKNILSTLVSRDRLGRGEFERLVGSMAGQRPQELYGDMEGGM